MRRFDGPAVITDEISQFQADVHRLALALVREVIREELDEKLAALRTGRQSKQAALPIPAAPPTGKRAPQTNKPTPQTSKRAPESRAKREAAPPTGKRAPAPRAKREPAPPSKRQSKRAAAAERQLELGLSAAPVTPAASVAVPPPTSSPQTELALAAAPPPAPTIAEQPAAEPIAAPTSAPKRGKWTRETVIAELAKWMSKTTTVDAPFLTRNGPPGLVAAARRIFGRFDAAMNVVALYISKTAPPEGAPPAPTP